MQEKINYIESLVDIVRHDQDLTIIENPREKKILELKRIVQDCQSTIECNGNTEFDRNELEFYVNLLHSELEK